MPTKLLLAPLDLKTNAISVYLYLFSECEKCDDCNCLDNQIGTCNKSNGECECSCKDGFKEDKCEECKENYWMSSSGEYYCKAVRRSKSLLVAGCN